MVSVDPAPSLDATTTEVCADLADALPDELDGLAARETDPESAATAAWGDPPVVLRCGVPVPDGFGPTTERFTVDDVAWYVEELTAGYRFTLVDRSTQVEVTVPDDYRPEVDVLVELGPMMERTIPVDDTEPD